MGDLLLSLINAECVDCRSSIFKEIRAQGRLDYLGSNPLPPLSATIGKPRPATQREERLRDSTTKYLHIWSTEQCLASSELLTPPPHPLFTQRVCPPPAPKAGGYTLALR
jgi:hypothetical protein